MEVKNASIRFSARCRDCADSHRDGVIWNLSAHCLALDKIRSAPATRQSNGHHRLAGRRLKRKIKLIKLLERKNTDPEYHVFQVHKLGIRQRPSL